MNPLVDIICKRNAGRVRLMFASYHEEPLPEILRRFGLGDDQLPDPWLREVKCEEARQILVSLLTHDMAYRAEIMTLGEAESLVDHFLNAFPAQDAKFVTNLDKPKDPHRPLDVASSPMTKSTFDSGVVCLSKPVAGCLWVEDED